MNIQTKRAIWFGIAHIMMLVACFFAAFILSMERFDEYDAKVSTVEYVSVSLSEILTLPGRYIWTSWASKNLHMERLTRMGVNILFVYGDPDNYGKFGFDADTSSRYLPPYVLQHPSGWQAINLDEDVFTGSTAKISCVEPLNDPALWQPPC